MKNFVISHSAALALLARIPNPRHGDTSSTEGADSSLLSHVAVPSDVEAAEIIEMLHLEIETLDILVSEPRARRRSKHLRTHLCTKPLPSGSFVPIEYWKTSIQLFVCSPELAFVQSLSIGDDLDAIYAGYMLTADYRIDHLEPSGLVQRDSAFMDSRLTTKQRISEYLDYFWSKELVKRARALLLYVNEGSRSPRESALAMFFSLPYSRGGQAAGKASLNRSFRIQDGKASFVRYPDILLEARAQWTPRSGSDQISKEMRYVALDYDSDSEHKRADRFEHDVRRRNEMEMLNNIAHFTITNKQATDFNYLVKLAKRIKRKLRIKLGPTFPAGLNDRERTARSKAIEARQFALWDRFIRSSRPW